MYKLAYFLTVAPKKRAKQIMYEKMVGENYHLRIPREFLRPTNSRKMNFNINYKL